jgi:glycosyltransferase involved in cell wall biosynthesis
LVKSHQALLDWSLPSRAFWQRFRLSTLARSAGCDVLFVAGGSFRGGFRPIVAFNQNLLPFEWREIARFGWSWMTAKMVMLRIMQAATFRRADGVIFLTRFARDRVVARIKDLEGRATIVPHGIDTRFNRPPREQLGIDRYSLDHPFRVLYVSTVLPYKHQWNVAEAVAQLRSDGLPVALEIVGAAYPPALIRLKRAMRGLDPKGAFLRYAGYVPYEELPDRYAQADLFVFASSCETFGQILTESMSAGLPIACANRSAMPELLGDAGVYFDPEDPRDIARALRELIDSPKLRAEKARASFARTQDYAWRRCAADTLAFLAAVARGTVRQDGR